MYQVARIMEAGIDSPYDVLGVNHNMTDVNIKKRYAFLYVVL
jgi:curved DNA-binding protein CbpA